ncbi:hypothetical protein [Phenylobacterium sp.]|uniref:hypothetical protein n=1 Tax=Phenylobacterium sp. TaxID=1871053 RepID=UPI00286A603F|nr:hypothetical protein [Phenylobacterium sp.]
MTLNLTVALCVACMAIAAFAGWRGAKPPNFAKGPRLAPWRLIMVTCAALALFFLVHIVNLLGVTTGR